jgi:hypothetical protein
MEGLKDEHINRFLQHLKMANTDQLDAMYKAVRTEKILRVMR